MERLGAIAGAPADVFSAGRTLLAEFGLPDEPLRDLEETVRLLGEFGADLERVRLDLGLSRGLQYYTGMVFEIDHAGLGSESQLCGGGRYDDLIRALGGKQPVPALGFSFGVERVKLALENEAGPKAGSAGRSAVFVVAASPEFVGYAARTADAIRAAGGAAFLEITSRPLRTSLAYADREGFTHVAVAGAAEAREGVVRLRRMAGGEEETVSLQEAAALRSALSLTQSTAGEDVDGG
jgi:histidyl-tRNA synthetase